MTRIAFITDVHADVHALRDALEQIDKLGCDETVCCGDYVDYGLFPVETVTLLQERVPVCLAGNHERWLVEHGKGMSGFDLPHSMVQWLASLPKTWRTAYDNVRVAVWHASPGSDMDGIYPSPPNPMGGKYSQNHTRLLLEAADADVLVVGHTHVSFEMTHSWVNPWGDRKQGKIVNPGALWRADNRKPAFLFDPETGSFSPGPRGGNGVFGILELPSTKWTVYDASDGSVAPCYRLAV